MTGNKAASFIFAFLLLISTAWAKEVPPRPEPARFVNDYAQLLSASERDALERKLQAYDDSTSNQVVIMIISSLEGEVVDEYSYKVATAWGIGQEYKNNGILILIAVQDRKIDMQVGTGLQGRIGDIGGAKKIVREIISPRFKEGKYYDGLDLATTEIAKMAAGEYKAPPKKKKDKRGPGVVSIVFIIIIIILASIFGRRRKGWGGFNRGGYYGGGWWGGGFGGGGSSGGGWGGGSSFGGGSFDGGGASGDW